VPGTQINTAHAHNQMKGTKGSLWGDRFWSSVVEPGQSVMNVVAYIEMNPVRAKIVEDPTELPYSSAGRTSDAIERGEQPSMPPLDFLAALPEALRPRIYVDLIRFIALAEREPDLQSQGLPILLTALGRQIDYESGSLGLGDQSPRQRVQADLRLRRIYARNLDPSRLADPNDLIESSHPRRARAPDRLNTPNQWSIVPLKTEDARERSGHTVGKMAVRSVDWSPGTPSIGILRLEPAGITAELYELA